MKSVCILIVSVLAALPLTAFAFGGGVAGATEITQLLNNVELAAATGHQASMVAEQVQTKLTALQQYATMMTNLKNLPQEVLDQALGPYQQQIDGLRQIYGAVTDVKQAADDTRNLFTRRIGEMQSLKMNPRDYQVAESALAAKKGGIYERQMRADLAALDNLRVRAEQLQTLSKKQVYGNVQGLDKLNQQTTMLTGEMMDLKAAILQQNAIANQERVEQERDKSVANDAARRNKEEEDRRDQRNKAFSENVQFKPSWSK